MICYDSFPVFNKGLSRTDLNSNPAPAASNRAMTTEILTVQLHAARAAYRQTEKFEMEMGTRTPLRLPRGVTGYNTPYRRGPAKEKDA